MFRVAIFCCIGFSELLMGQVYQHRQDAGDLYIVAEALRDDLVHFELGAGLEPEEAQAIYKSPMIREQEFSGPTEFRRFENGFETRDLIVRVNPSLCAIVYDKTQEVQINEICPDNLRQEWKTIKIDSPRTTNVYGLGQYFTNPGTADGDWMGRVWDPLQYTHGNALRGFSGGANSYAMFPIAYAIGEAYSHNYAILLDQPYKQLWSFQENPWHIGMWGDKIRWFLFPGSSLAELRQKFMDLTGRPDIPPKNMFGLWVSEFGYDSWDEVRETLSSLRQNDFPVDGFALDIQWFGGTFFERGDDTRPSRFGTLRFHGDGFNNHIENLQFFKDQGIGLMPIEESYVSLFLDEHRILESHGYMAKDCQTGEATFLDYNPWWGVGGMIDWTNPAGADFWHDLKRQPLIDLGISYHWVDLGEPEMYSSNSCYYGFPELGKHRHVDVHNLYNLKWIESIYRGYERNNNRLRPFSMSRSGTIGIQRYAAAIWSGDIGANMGALTAHYNVQMHMSLSGVDYYGSDTGGFHRRLGTMDGDEGALFTQWLANSSLFDFPFRTHSWNLSGDVETSPSEIGHIPSNRFNVKQRYELAPYYYTLAYRAHRYGEPVIPPMVHEYQDDDFVRQMGNQKMIGRNLMAAMVAGYGQSYRDVYLPEGKWVNYHSNEWYESSGEEICEVPAHQDDAFRLPIFAKAGAIIPLASVSTDTDNIFGSLNRNNSSEVLRLKVFAHMEPTSFELYEDDGTSRDYKDGMFTLTKIAQSMTALQSKVVIEPTKGNYEGSPDNRSFALELVLDQKRASGATLNGQALPPCRSAVDTPIPAERKCWKNDGRNLVKVFTGLHSTAVTKTVSVSLEEVTASSSALFVCENAVTDLGTSVYIVGNIPELGRWKPSKAIKLDAIEYPNWSKLVRHLPTNKKIEWKCLKRKSEGDEIVGWEANQRVFQTSDKGYSGVQVGGF